LKPGMLIFTMKLGFNLVSDMAIKVGLTSVIWKKFGIRAEDAYFLGKIYTL